MPEWLLSFCVNSCIIAGTILSWGLFIFLAIVIAVEIWDFFHEEPSTDDDEGNWPKAPGVY